MTSHAGAIVQGHAPPTQAVGVERGMAGIKSSNRTQFKIGTAVAILLGTIFIAGQIYEWFNLFDEGLNAHSTTYGSAFFLITGFHAAHVIAGLCMLWVVLVRAFRND